MFGRNHSEDTKAKISAAGIGRPPWNKGKALSEEHKNALRKPKRKKKDASYFAD